MEKMGKRLKKKADRGSQGKPRMRGRKVPLVGENDREVQGYGKKKSTGTGKGQKSFLKIIKVTRVRSKLRDHLVGKGE